MSHNALRGGQQWSKPTLEPRVAHGAPLHAAKAIQKEGVRIGDRYTSEGPAIYTTRDMMLGAYYADQWGGTRRQAGEPRGKKTTGRVFVYAPKGPPLKDNDTEVLHTPETLGKPVHIQNVNRTTVQRLQRRMSGGSEEAPIPSVHERLAAFKETGQLDPRVTNKPPAPTFDEFN